MISKQVLDIITKSNIEIYNYQKEEYPSVFYIGFGKCGSQSICAGFTNNKVAHWHSEQHFKDTYGIDIAPLTLLDIIDYISNLKKVLIIESVRDPISRTLSLLFQEFYFSRIDPKLAYNVEFIKNWIINYLNNNKISLYANNWKKYYNIDIFNEFDVQKKYYYTVFNPNIQLLFIRYEDISNHKNIIANIGYTFYDQSVNITSFRDNFRFKESYEQAKQKIKFPLDDLERWYSSQLVKSFYSDKEIESFILKNKE